MRSRWAYFRTVFACLPIALMGVVFTAEAGVTLEKITDFGPGETISYVNKVILDEGQITLEYYPAPALHTTLGFFAGPAAGQITPVFDDTMSPPGFTTPCLFLNLGHASAGHIYFECGSETETGMFGTYVWANAAIAALVNRAGGVPGCSGLLSSVGFGWDSSDASAGIVLSVASTLEIPACFGVYSGDPSGTSSIVHSGSPFPEELGESFGVNGVATDGTSTASLWMFAPQEFGIFVNRGQGLETWVTTGPNTPRFDHPYASFGPKMRWSQGNLVFQYGINQEHGLVMSDGSSIVTVVDTNTFAPGSESLFVSIDFDDWTYSAAGVSFRASSDGEQVDGIYNWMGGTTSLIAKPGMILPGSTEPISWLTDLAASDDFIVFQTGHLDGNRSIYAYDSGDTTLIASTRNMIDGRQPVGFYLYGDDGIDGREMTFEVTFDDGGNSVYLATLITAQQVPAFGPLGGFFLAIAIGVAGSLRLNPQSPIPMSVSMLGSGHTRPAGFVQVTNAS